MNESILNTIKKLLGIEHTYEAFDVDLKIHINSVFSILTQMGVGPESGFTLINGTQTWDSYFDKDGYREKVKPEYMQQIITYVYTKVKVLFDPPTSGILMEALNKTLHEMEVRMYTQNGGY